MYCYIHNIHTVIQVHRFSHMYDLHRVHFGLPNYKCLLILCKPVAFQLSWGLLTLGTCARVTVVILCVCLCICYRASCYIPHLYVENRVPLRFLCHCHWFNVCIVWILLKTLRSKVLARFTDHHCLLRILMNSRWRRDSNGFFSRTLACRTSDGSYNSTDYHWWR